jgi:hypothetical protein
LIHKANSVFTRIAAYTWAELHNKPHNIIRHPDMPRVVFQLLWDYIQAGKPIVAYIKNLAHDGRYYWVMALVTPMPDGYLSVRFKPTSPLRHDVEQLYRELRAVEAAIEDQSQERKTAIAASRAVLESALQKLGFSYFEFMRLALKSELQRREAKLDTAAQSTEFSLAVSILSVRRRRCLTGWRLCCGRSSPILSNTCRSATACARSLPALQIFRNHCACRRSMARSKRISSARKPLASVRCSIGCEV